MALPVVAIIGRPNVGKSSLLNALAGQMISIVEPTAGVTRDRVSAIIKKIPPGTGYFELVDTGGYGIVDDGDLTGHIQRQIRQAIESADLAVFMVDIRDGLLPLDEQIARLLRKSARGGLDVILVANKADNARMFPAAAEFSKLGFGDALCISALNNLNKAVLLDEIARRIESAPPLAGQSPQPPPEVLMKLAIVGRRNVGKSTLLNSIVGAERVIVSELPGTTRDAIDVRFETDGKTYILIDTAGIRKKKRIVSNSIEFYSYTRTTRSIKRADVVFFLIDATMPVSKVDKQLADFITEQYKACILVINKWDLAKAQATTEDYTDYLYATLPHLRHAPIAFTTATQGKNVQRLFDIADALFSQAATQLTTARLNKVIESIKAERPAAAKKAKPPKIFYTTQVAGNPVTLLMFVNSPELFDDNYRRFLLNRLHQLLPIEKVPIQLLLRKRPQ